MDIVYQIELLDGMCETNEEKDSQYIRRCCLVDLQNPFEKLDDYGFKTRFRLRKIAVQCLFNIIRNDHELWCVNNAVPETLHIIVAVLGISCEGAFPTD